MKSRKFTYCGGIRIKVVGEGLIIVGRCSIKNLQTLLTESKKFGLAKGKRRIFFNFGGNRMDQSFEKWTGCEG